MNQFVNCLQSQTKRILPTYQQIYQSKSPQGKQCLIVNQQYSPKNEQKYMKQFKCIDQYKHQQPKTIIYPQKRISPKNKSPLIATKLRIQDKENNNHQYYANIIFQPCKTPRNPQYSQKNSSNIKQPTPEFENRYQDRNLEFRLSISEINFRFVDSQKHKSVESQKHISEEQELKNIVNQFNKIEIGKKESESSPKSIKSDEFLVQMDSLKKSGQCNQFHTKNIGIQAFESIQFENPEEQLCKIFGSQKKVKIIKKKQTQPTLQTQITQKTMEDDSLIKIDAQQDQQTKTISGLSNIDFQSEKLQTEFTDLDSHRIRHLQIDEPNQFTHFKQNIATPKQLTSNNISFLMYKKQFEKQL